MIKMSKFLTPLRVEDVNGDVWTLFEPLRYFSELAGGILEVEAGFKTDFASIPGFAQNLISKNGLWDFGAVLHDKLYSENGRIDVEQIDGATVERTFPRNVCDAILLEAMQAKGVGVIRRTLIFHAVRHFGWAAWNKHAKAILVCGKIMTGNFCCAGTLMLSKFLLLAIALTSLTGCISGSRLAKELAKSDASVSLSVNTIYGTVKFSRANPREGQTATISPDGTLTVTARK